METLSQDEKDRTKENQLRIEKLYNKVIANESLNPDEIDTLWNHLCSNVNARLYKRIDNKKGQKTLVFGCEGIKIED